jgi:hypothetical protein
MLLCLELVQKCVVAYWLNCDEAYGMEKRDESSIAKVFNMDPVSFVIWSHPELFEESISDS